MPAKLEAEFKFYQEHQEKFVAQFGGKFIVIKGTVVLGAFDSELEAITETCKMHELGTFLVQKCEAGRDSYTQTYHSRVAFG